MNARILMLSFGLAAAAILASGPACAQVYKWVDDRGRTHYGQQPPPASAGVPTKLDIGLTGNDPPATTVGCYSIQCQYERLRNDRLVRDAEWRKDEESRARIAADRRASEQPAAPQADPRWSGVYPGSPLYVGRPVFHHRVPVAQPASPAAPAEPAVRIRMQVGR